MDAASLAAFATTLLVVAVSPGPNNAVIAARVLGGDRPGAVAYGAGVCLGDLAMLTLVYSGMTLWTRTLADALLVIKWLGIAYILLLAWGMWQAAGRSRPIDAPRRACPAQMLLVGIAASLGNPHGVLFYLALVPPILGSAPGSVPGYLALALTNCLVLALVWCCLILLASQARRRLEGPQGLGAVNRGAAAAMVGVAVWMAAM